MIPLAVFGDPIGHSLSPQLHQIFARQTGVAVDYRAILAPPARFAQQLKSFFDEGGVGANITLPHKQTVLSLVDRVSEHAARAGAANTLFWQDQQLVADNTDGRGLLLDLQGRRSLQDARVLIMGAGGAVRGILQPLLAAGCARIEIKNRTITRAQQLINHFNDPRLVLYQGAGHYDLVINASSAGHQRTALGVDPNWFARGSLAYDLSYGDAAHDFVQQARAIHVEACDGLGMLVAQGALSFTLWTGEQVDFRRALQTLRLQIESSC